MINYYEKMFIIYSAPIGFLASWPLWIGFFLPKYQTNLDIGFLITIVLGVYEVLYPFLFFYFIMRDLKISILQLHFTLGAISISSVFLSCVDLLDFFCGNNFFKTYIEKLSTFYFFGGGCLIGYLGFCIGTYFKEVINFVKKKIKK
jgi:hypothetical protein